MHELNDAWLADPSLAAKELLMFSLTAKLHSPLVKMKGLAFLLSSVHFINSRKGA